MNENRYGFYIEEYEDGSQIRTLMTGDGKALFTDLHFEDGCKGVGFSYGNGVGIGVEIKPPSGTKANEVGVEFQVKFERPDSIQSLIDRLEQIKREMEEQPQRSEDSE